MHQTLFDYFTDVQSRLEEYFQSLGVNLVRQDHSLQEPLDITSLIHVHGPAEGGLLFTVDQSLANQLAHRFMIDPLTEDEAQAYSVDVVAEITNIISANSLRDDRGKPFTLGLPYMIATHESRFKPGSGIVHICGWVSPFGRIRCILTEIQQPEEIKSILTIC